MNRLRRCGRDSVFARAPMWAGVLRQAIFVRIDRVQEQRSPNVGAPPKE